MGLTKEGRVKGKFRATGIRPRCSEKLQMAGMTLGPDMFEHTKLIA
jgi:pilus assembly protein CpaF